VTRKKKFVFLLIKWVSELTLLTYQPTVGQVGFKFFWFANKWVRLGWVTQKSTPGGSDRVTRFGSSNRTSPFSLTTTKFEASLYGTQPVSLQRLVLSCSITHCFSKLLGSAHLAHLLPSCHQNTIMPSLALSSNSSIPIPTLTLHFRHYSQPKP